MVRREPFADTLAGNPTFRASLNAEAMSPGDSACWPNGCLEGAEDLQESTHAECLQARTPAVSDDVLAAWTPQTCGVAAVLPMSVGVAHSADARTAHVIEAPRDDGALENKELQTTDGGLAPFILSDGLDRSC